MQLISWEVMKIYPLEIYEIRYLSFVLSGTLHVSYVCPVQQTEGPACQCLNTYIKIKEFRKRTFKNSWYNSVLSILHISKHLDSSP